VRLLGENLRHRSFGKQSYGSASFLSGQTPFQPLPRSVMASVSIRSSIVRAGPSSGGRRPSNPFG